MLHLNKPLIFACIPAYNEEKTLPTLLLKCKEYVNIVLVCDDGSTDSTSNLAKKFGAEVIKHERNLGKGRALQTLFKSALDRGAKILVTLDADGSHIPDDIPSLLNPILKLNSRVDVVIGSRFMKGGYGLVSRLNFFGNKFINAVTFLVTGRLLSDSQSGFRAVKSWVLDDMELNAEGYEVESELTIKCINTPGCKILEVPIKCGRSLMVSGLDSFRDGLKIIHTILKTTIFRSDRQVTKNWIKASWLTYLRKNLGAPFIVSFMALMLTCTGLIIKGDLALANEVSIYAYYSLAIGVILQLINLLTNKEKTSE